MPTADHEPSRHLLPGFDELVRLTRALGHPEFPQFLWAFFNARVPVACLELCCHTRNTARTKMVNIEWLGTASGAGYPDDDLEQEAKTYLESHWHLDPLMPLVIGLEGTRGHQITPDQVRTEEARQEWFDGGLVPEHYAICEAFGDFIYVLYFMRTAQQPPFSEEERAALHHMADFALPLLRNHAEILPARLSILDHNPTLRKHLTRQLERHGVELSPREFDVCLAVLSGKPLAQMADDLGLQASSVKTYTARAFEKIGVSGKGELFSWCFTSPNP
ncbi:helix-turn-helix transcriptional regulator [Ideonella sp.]|uniref:helix-turn-helix transcriptional regulator n=1 Tax=Ideonella sp. TaxID=1929293 RepID=UPI0035AD84D9